MAEGLPGARAASDPAAEGRLARLLPWLLPLCAVLPDPRAAWPGLTYYFRDFTVTFYPLRLFAARELRAGRLALWNPFVHEGTFAFPTLYPGDLLLALSPSPALASFLLTLHLPLAALAAYALGRELGLSRTAAFVTGTCYAVGGFAISCLNLYVFLQALALAPLLVLAMRRAARDGGRMVGAAAVAVALCVSTLAVEMVAQALLVALLLGLEARLDAAAARRMAAATLLGAALAAAPVFQLAGLLPETVRGAGFQGEVASANALQPAALLQVLVPNLLGPLQSPAEGFWGGGLFSKGIPYFLSLYLGPLVLGLAFCGAGATPRSLSALLLGLGGLGLWFALGDRGGLAPLLLALPPLRSFRFPSKAFFLPFLAAALLAGLGAERLRRGAGWPGVARVWALGVAACLACAAAALAVPELPSRVLALQLADPRPLASRIALELAETALVCGAGLLLALAVRSGRLAPARAVALLSLALVADLARAGAGVNPQVPAAFFDAPPGLEALRLGEAGRVFSYETERSPAVRAFLARGGPAPVYASFLMHRRLLAPYTNVIDSVETALGKDLTSFAPRPPELRPEDLDPGRIGAILPRLRNAAVSHVLSLDPILHPDLAPRAELPAGPRGMTVRAYALRDPVPRAYLACRVLGAPTAEAALDLALRPGFDAAREVALEEPGSAACADGSVRRLESEPRRALYAVTADGPGFLVVRESHARGWIAAVDGKPAPILRANGKHRAVPVPAGEHRVELRYEAPGLLAGAALSLLGVVVTLAIAVRPPARQSGEPAAG